MLLSIVVARILSLDVGEKRIGVALSDPSGTIAQALKLYMASGSRSHDVAGCEVGRVVVGLPGNLDGSVGPKAQEFIHFAEEIGKASGVPVDLWDERFSTDEAHRIFDVARNAEAR